MYPNSERGTVPKPLNFRSNLNSQKEFSIMEAIQTKFNFRTVDGVKRETILLDIAPISLQEALDAGEASIKYLESLIYGEFVSAARSILSEDMTITGKDNFPWEKLIWNAIITENETERKGRGIPKETWEEFAKDFLAVMEACSTKSEAQLKNVATIIKNKLQPVKFNKPVLEKVVSEYLAVYVQSATRLEEFSDVVEFLQKKAEEFLTLDQTALADAL